MAIGRKANQPDTADLASRARSMADQLPDLMVRAEKIATNAALGWHGRRKRGVGEDFWQFRPYVNGEALTDIDWRRSARDDNFFIRDREWDMAQTIWIWPDRTASMRFCSHLSHTPKIDCALIIALVMAKLFAQAGENVGIPSILPPTNLRAHLEKMTVALANQQQASSLPPIEAVSKKSFVIIISDFLDDTTAMLQQLSLLAQQNISALLIEIADPAEELFPYTGRIEFEDSESALTLNLGRAESVQTAYQKLYIGRREELRVASTRYGWGYLTHHTDRPLSETILRAKNLMIDVPALSRGHS